MSLKDPDDEYDEILPKGGGFLGKFVGKGKKTILIAGIGAIIGILITLYFINPLIGEAQNNTCKDCIYLKGTLTSENECLYSLLAEPKKASEQCAAKRFDETITQPQTDKNGYTEEPA